MSIKVGDKVKVVKLHRALSRWIGLTGTVMNDRGYDQRHFRYEVYVDGIGSLYFDDEHLELVEPA